MRRAMLLTMIMVNLKRWPLYHRVSRPAISRSRSLLRVAMWMPCSMLSSAGWCELMKTGRCRIPRLMYTRGPHPRRAFPRALVGDDALMGPAGQRASSGAKPLSRCPGRSLKLHHLTARERARFIRNVQRVCNPPRIPRYRPTDGPRSPSEHTDARSTCLIISPDSIRRTIPGLVAPRNDRLDPPWVRCPSPARTC